MKPELFHYIHCPFCVRVRLAMGYLGQDYTSQVLDYDDELTPVKLTGKKMLPIVRTADRVMNESLDIIRHLDVANRLHSERWENLDETLDLLGSYVHNLAMPYWVWMPEFTERSRQYFVAKKSLKRGPFPALAAKRKDFEIPLLNLLSSLEERLVPFYESTEISIKDIGIASHLWGLFIVPEFRFPERWHNYLMQIKELCHFDYYQGHWGRA